MSFFAIAIAIALAVIFGWAINSDFLKSMMLITSSMKVNTAICIALLGAAGIFGTRPDQTSRVSIAQFLAFTVLAIAVASGLETAFDFNFGIDELFFKDVNSVGHWPPGRPSPVTLLGFAFLSISIIARDQRSDFAKKAAEYWVMAACVIPLQAIVSFCFGVSSSFGLALYAQMAPHTALAMVILSAGLIASRPNHGILQILRAQTEADRVGRLLLVCAVFLPPCFYWGMQRGSRSGLWDLEYGSVIRIVLQVSIFSWIAYIVASRLRGLELKERETQSKLRIALGVRDEFLSVASHELKTPLTALKLQAAIVERKVNESTDGFIDTDRVQKLIRQTHRGVSRMTRLIEDMLDVSRIQVGQLSLKPEATDLAHLIEECMAECTPQIEAANISLTLTLEHGIILNLDRERFGQVISNLTTNAIRYAPGKPLEIYLSQTEWTVNLEFRDQGTGIDPKDHVRIFERFERLVSANEVSGLGLGLFIVKKIVNAHRGHIEVRSAKGQGAIFAVTLPRE